MPKRAIQTYSTHLGIPRLVHFTKAENLPMILRHGLYPLSRLNEIGAQPVVNDQLRLDGHPDSSSISIAFPNCQMFYRYRQENVTTEWIVMSLAPEVLWDKNVGFCKHNAADGRISAIPQATLQEPQSFYDMYNEIPNWQTRAEQRLRAYDPTDVQAEVLVFDIIEPRYIIAVDFNSLATRNTYMGQLGTIPGRLCGTNTGCFGTRSYNR